jgi:subtilase family serine protease
MSSKIKIILTVLVIGLVAGLAVLQVQNKELIKGQIFGDKNVEEELGTPDLKPTLEALGADDNNNLRVRVTVENLGEGPVLGENPYNYTLYINDVLVMTNTDSYTRMDPGDSFSFIYPIDREVYTYEDTGTVKVVIDKDNSIEELDEGNNESVAGYVL